MFGHELCVVITNLNTTTEEYFHPKTTPDVPIRLAVRMSMSVPGTFLTPTTITCITKPSSVFTSRAILSSPHQQ